MGSADRNPDRGETRADGDSLQVTQRWDGGAGWIAHPDERMQRASQALVVDGDVWVVDPVDVPGVDDLLADLGDVVGVVVGLDRHTRDAPAVARRHDVPVWLPTWMTGVADDLDATIERFERDLAGGALRAIKLVDRSLPPWREVALYRDDDGTLVVPEAVGTASYYCVGDERLGVHPMLRPFPPRRALGSLTPERILTGHGPGVADHASSALADALAGSRRRMPALYGKALRLLVR